MTFMNSMLPYPFRQHTCGAVRRFVRDAPFRKEAKKRREETAPLS